jgi:GNAT superfamily N-acetyltransferase
MNSLLIEITNSAHLASLESSCTIVGNVRPLAPENLLYDVPDAHWVLLRGETSLAARCSLWWKKTPPYPGHSLGLIGHYAASDSHSGSQVLRHACQQLVARGCTIAVGPMDGNTWRHYRFITERGAEPAFFLEPDNPDDWPLHFTAAGFAALATYTSALDSNLTPGSSGARPRICTIAENISRMGITIRQASAAHMDVDLQRIYAVSLHSFQNNFLYTPLEESEFLAQYRKLLPFVRHEFVLLAERDSIPVGFLFGVPDALRIKLGERNDTIIIKTVAVVPECASGGLGTLLVARIREIAHGLGYTRCIHALMHESNRSRNISAKTASTVRRYALFARQLSP